MLSRAIMAFVVAAVVVRAPPCGITHAQINGTDNILLNCSTPSS